MKTPAFTVVAPVLHRHQAARRSATNRRSAAAPVSLARSSFLYQQPLRCGCSFTHHSSPSASPRTPNSPTMALSHVVVAGGTGFVGSRLVRALVSAGTRVTVLTRSRSSAGGLPKEVAAVVWAPDKLAAVGNDWVGWERSLAGADLVVNLCGEPVVSKWDDAGKKRILESRVKSTRALAEAIAKMSEEERPKCFASASAVGYYGSSAVAEFDENASPAENDFLADVCVQWEKAATEPLQAVEGTRVVIVRTGVVMGVGGGALARMLPAFKFFVGGPIGSGKQWVSWVHIDDLTKIYIEAGENESMEGVYNATAPNPVTMGQMSQSLASALNRPNLFPVPGFVLKAVLGGASSIVLEGQKVLPKRLLAGGFKFNYEKVDSAMQAVAEEA